MFDGVMGPKPVVSIRPEKFSDQLKRPAVVLSLRVSVNSNVQTPDACAKKPGCEIKASKEPASGWKCPIHGSVAVGSLITRGALSSKIVPPPWGTLTCPGLIRITPS